MGRKQGEGTLGHPPFRIKPKRRGTEGNYFRGPWTHPSCRSPCCLTTVFSCYSLFPPILSSPYCFRLFGNTHHPRGGPETG